jgi:hypothetical protein
MAYSATLNLVAGDTLPELTIKLKDSNQAAAGKVLDTEDPSTWAAINVADATVRLRLRAVGSSTVKSTLVCTVTDGVNGAVATNFPTGTLDTSGIFEGEIEITFGNGGIQSVYDLIKLKVRSDFD